MNNAYSVYDTTTSKKHPRLIRDCHTLAEARNLLELNTNYYIQYGAMAIAAENEARQIASHYITPPKKDVPPIASNILLLDLVSALKIARSHHAVLCDFRYIPRRDKHAAYITQIHSRAMSVPGRAA